MMCVTRWPKLICSAVGLNANLSPGMASIAPRRFFCDRGQSIRTEVASGSLVAPVGLGTTVDFGVAVGLAGFAAGISCACNLVHRPEARRTKSVRACFMEKPPRQSLAYLSNGRGCGLDDGNVLAKRQPSWIAGETGPEPAHELSMARRFAVLNLPPSRFPCHRPCRGVIGRLALSGNKAAVFEKLDLHLGSSFQQAAGVSMRRTFGDLLGRSYFNNLSAVHYGDAGGQIAHDRHGV